jgi:transposase-like protein
MAAPKKYSDELRERATRLALESGRPIAHVAQDLGVHKEALIIGAAENASRELGIDRRAELEHHHDADDIAALRRMRSG